MGDAGNAGRRRRHGLGRPGPRVGRRARIAPRRGRPLDAAALGHELPRDRHRPWARRQRSRAAAGRRLRNESLRVDSAAALARAVTHEDGLANWSSEGKLQWCAGAPGVVSAARDYLDEELLLGGAQLVWGQGRRIPRKATESATAHPATASRCSPPSSEPRTSCGSLARAASRFTRSDRPRACPAATRSSRAEPALRSSPPPA